MKLVEQFLALAALTISSSMAAASNGSLNEFVPKVLPVLVQVNAHGDITGVSPATTLQPKLDRLLRANLDEMINEPAFDERGRPKSSQFILNLAVQASPRPDGDFDVKFAYVSTSPVPSGSWYWVHIDGHRLALASQDSRNHRGRIPIRYERPSYWNSSNRPSIPNRNGMRMPARGAAPPHAHNPR